MFTKGESVAKGQKVGKGHVLVINNHATPLAGVTATAAAYDADGSVIHTQRWKVEAPASQATDLGRFDAVAKVAKLHFIKLQLRDQAGKLLSDNFYWRGAFNRENNLQALATLPTVKLEAAAKRADAGGKCLLEVTLRNPSGNIALMAHLQLRRQSTGQRVLPVFCSDNYVSLIPGESKSITVEANSTDLKGDQPLLTLDGWNVTVSPVSSGACAVAPNPKPSSLRGRRPDFRLDTSRHRWSGFSSFRWRKWKGKGIEDSGFVGGVAKKEGKISVDASAVPSAAKGLSFIFSRVGTFAYTFPMKPFASGYTVRMYFATDTNAAADTRFFNVDINGKRVLEEFDIFAAAGGNAKAVMKEFPRVVPDKDGNIVINFRPGKTGEPRVSRIEVVPAGE